MKFVKEVFLDIIFILNCCIRIHSCFFSSLKQITKSAEQVLTQHKGIRVFATNCDLVNHSFQSCRLIVQTMIK